MSQKITVCTIRYSDNLGDGAISQTLCHVLKDIRPDANIVEMDLAGRTGYGGTDVSKKAKVKSILYKMPSVVRQVVVFVAWLLKLKPCALAEWEKVIKPNTVLVFGGGQLLQDNDLNFPLKIAALVDFASERKCSIAFNAVGVSAKWSPWAKKLFTEALLNPAVKFISVRDHNSYRHLISHLGDEIESKLTQTVDPAVWSEDVYGRDEKAKNDVIGLGVAHPGELKGAAESPEDFSVDKIRKFWVDLAENLAGQDKKVLLFTNGSEEDENFLQVVAEDIEESIEGGRVQIVKRAKNPEQLARKISGMQAVVAHRLHANIIAYAYGVPSVGLIWDKKVRSFAELTERTDFFVDSKERKVKHVISCLDKALVGGKHHEKLSGLKTVVREKCEKMLKNLGV